MNSLPLPIAVRGRKAGFTLIELLVVVMVVGILTSLAVLSIGVTGGDTQLQKEARRLAALIEMAGEESLLQGRDIGIHLREGQYGFYAFVPQTRAWMPLDQDDLFRRRELPEYILLALTVEGTGVSLDAEEQPEITPQVMILSSGEFNQFEISLYAEDSEQAFLISGNPDGTLEVSQDDRYL